MGAPTAQTVVQYVPGKNHYGGRRRVTTPAPKALVKALVKAVFKKHK